MKLTLIIAAILILGFSAFTWARRPKSSLNLNTEGKPSLYDSVKTVKALDGKTDIDLSSFKGKKLLIVNVASECGYTPQYEDLQKLQTQYGTKVNVIGFPCNQFGGQEPGTPGEIAEFCRKNYGVTFPISEKVDVKGEKQHPVYSWLTKKNSNAVGDYEVKWNFCKFLLDENGRLLGYFSSAVKPMDEQLISLIK